MSLTRLAARRTCSMQVWLANPRGFCAGVARAVEIVERALEAHGPPVYVRHEIVHNARVVDTLRRKGAVFVQDFEAVPPGAITVFSAHGVAPDVVAAAQARRLDVVDATCPLVAKVHREARRYAEAGRELIVVGHAEHPEVVGTLGHVAGRAHVVASVADVDALPLPPDARVAYVTQTTLSVSDTAQVVTAIERRFPDVVGPSTRDICYATHNRQQAVRELAARCQFVIVVGAAHSSNSRRLHELARSAGCGAALVADAADLERDWFEGLSTVGVTAGASAPEELVREVLARLGDWFPLRIEELAGRVEEVVMPLPPRLATRRPAPELRA